MASKENMIRGAIEATGDEEITVAGLFVPRGLVGRIAVGAIAGGFVGSIAGPAGSAAGTAIGAGAGAASVGQDGLSWVVAVTPTKVHVLNRPFSPSSDARSVQTLIHTYDRTDLTVEVKTRAFVRVVVLDDNEGEARVELEAARPRQYSSEVIHALVIEGHGIDEDDDLVD